MSGGGAWSETTKIRERMRFVLDGGGELFTMVEPGERCGISGITGHEWLRRYWQNRVGGWNTDVGRAVLPASARPGSRGSPARRQHPYWGACKLTLPSRAATRSEVSRR
jgi:hypothetical protein